MMLYLQNFGSDSTDPATLADFESELTTLEGKMTNYGCYCWIQGTADGVIGGGKTKDMVDHHCKELYRCYKCVLNDYSANYTDVAYSVDFIEDAAGNRQLDCSNNPKQDGENVCECDKRFAENIAKAEQVRIRLEYLKYSLTPVTSNCTSLTHQFRTALLTSPMTSSGAATAWTSNSEPSTAAALSTHRTMHPATSSSTVTTNRTAVDFTPTGFLKNA